MKAKIDKCQHFRDDRSNPSVTEKGKVYQIDNSKKKYEIGCTKIDNCVFNAKDGIKCDFLFDIGAVKTLFYVELKGSDVVHAIQQVHATIEQTKAHFNGWKYAARIVVSKNRVPNIRNTKEYRALYALVNKNIEIKENIYRELL